MQGGGAGEGGEEKSEELAFGSGVCAFLQRQCSPCAKQAFALVLLSWHRASKNFPAFRHLSACA